MRKETSAVLTRAAITYLVLRDYLALVKHRRVAKLRGAGRKKVTKVEKILRPFISHGRIIKWRHDSRLDTPLLWEMRVRYRVLQSNVRFFDYTCDEFSHLEGISKVAIASEG